MGGLISHYALLRYPNVFGAAGVFSPSYWICDDELIAFENQFPLQTDQHIYVLAGGKEGRSMKKLSKKHVTHLQEQQPNSQSVKLVFDKNGMHNELFWSQYLAESFMFLLEEY
jgi:predicted alpha/beta superfamily hydrolase